MKKFQELAIQVFDILPYTNKNETHISDSLTGMLDENVAETLQKLKSDGTGRNMPSIWRILRFNG